jgi:hypothetical protein
MKVTTKFHINPSDSWKNYIQSDMETDQPADQPTNQQTDQQTDQRTDKVFYRYAWLAPNNYKNE